MAAGAGDAFGCTGCTSDGLFNPQSSGSGSASDRLAASVTTGAASDAVRFAYPVDESGGHYGDGTDDGDAGVCSRGFVDDAAIDDTTIDDAADDDAANGTVATGIAAVVSDGATDDLLAAG